MSRGLYIHDGMSEEPGGRHGSIRRLATCCAPNKIGVTVNCDAQIMGKKVVLFQQCHLSGNHSITGGETT